MKKIIFLWPLFLIGCTVSQWNANEMLKYFNTHLIEKIRSDMAEVPIAGK